MGMPSAGVWVLIYRRWVCASSRAISSSKSKMRPSNHGPISITASGKLPSGHSSEATIVCIHVVPHLGEAHTKMSPGRWLYEAHLELSMRADLYTFCCGLIQASYSCATLGQGAATHY